MKLLVLTALGGAIGASSRYLVYVAVARLIGTGFPFATMIVNIVGSLFMGALVEGAALRWSMSLEWRTFLMVGILGAFTTFSTFSLDAITLLERDRLGAAAIYVLVSVFFSIGALFAGMAFMRRMLA